MRGLRQPGLAHQIARRHEWILHPCTNEGGDSIARFLRIRWFVRVRTGRADQLRAIVQATIGIGTID
jgi:hypothetical protein